MHVNYRVCETLWQEAFPDTEGGVIETLELKTKGSNTLSKRNAFPQGVSIVDTDDWYTDACALFPESDEDLNRRYDLVRDYYKGYQTRDAQGKKKNVCVIVATHAAFNFNLPSRFGSKEESGMGLIYCASF